MGAKVSKALGVEVEQIARRYGEFTVLVEGEALLEAGPLGWLGLLPAADEVLEKVRSRLKL